MRKAITVILAFLLLPSLPGVNAQPNLIDVGVIDTIDGKFVHTSFSSSSTLLTLTSDGNLSEHFWGSGELITQWSIELNVSANSANLDSTGLQVAVAHTEGVLVINTQSREITSEFNSSNSVDFADWDSEGDMWYGFYGGERRAKEFNNGMETGTGTQPHNTAMTSIALISQDRIVTGGRDNLVKVSTNDGTLERSISDFNSYPTQIVNDGNGNIIVGCSNGDLFRYDFTDWTKEEMSVSSSQSIYSITIGESGKIFVGTQNGRLHQINETTFTEEEEYTSSGRVILGATGVDGEIYIISTVATESRIKLFDLDTDGDGITDSMDAFPYDSSQSLDSDGDGYGDNPQGNNSDQFKNDVSQWVDADGDGKGDNPEGNDSDAFPSNPDQWSDSDGDGYGDNSNKQGGDRFPNDPTQWVDSDGDGFGDNQSGTNGDDCPNQNGFSTIDRAGCKDTDNDGYSDPTDNWTIEDGADFAIYDKSQWVDSDGDNYGDNLTGNKADGCPETAGNSTKWYIVEFSSDGSFDVTYVTEDKFGCLDSDGDGFWDEADDLPNDPKDYIDKDKDGVGESQDYNDSNKLVKTLNDYCELFVEDESEDCQGARDADYQNYVSDKRSDGEKALDYFAWQRSQEEDKDEKGSSEEYLEKASEILPFLGAGFAGIVAILLIYAAIGKTRRRRALVKTYGVPFVPGDENSAETEALEGKAGLSGSGGVDSDKYWDDDVAPMEMAVGDDGNELGSGFDDIDIKGETDVSQSQEVMEEDSSLEELAGLPEQTKASEVTAEPVQQQAATPPEAPPLPAEGLPEGWTMDQWKWYGAQWLANQGK